MKPFAFITEAFTESVIREMTRISDSLGGLNLSQGFPDFDAPDEIKQAAFNAISNGYNQYPITYGESELREAIAKKALQYNKINYNPETEISVTCGATEAMIATLKALINPGDEVIIFEPYYENYGPDTILSGATPKYVTLHEPDWHINEEELKNSFTKKTKAIVINTPNNPTGKVFSRKELELIANLCNQFDAYAITDEIYEHILYDDHQHISIASLEGMRDRTITINSASKTYSVTGWRVGWAIASENITKQIRKVHDFLTVGAPCPLQHAVAFALYLPEQYYVSLAIHYRQLRKLLIETLTQVGFTVNNPQGAYYIMANIEKLKPILNVKSDFEFSLGLLKKTKVASVPGSSFYSKKEKGSNIIRFCFCKKQETLKQVDNNLKKWMNYD